MSEALSLKSPPAGSKAPASWLAGLKHRVKIKSRKVRRPRIISIDGIRLEVDRSRLAPSVVRALYRESYEDKEAAIVRQIVAPGDRVLEIGAGIGFITLLCARQCGAEAVLAYEANPENEPIVRRNFALNGLPPHFRSRAVSVSKGECTLFITPNLLSTSVIDRGDGREISVPCDAISDVVREFRPNCLVMDVEGAEIDLLPAAPLDQIAKIILEIHPHIVGVEAVQRLESHLKAAGFARFGAPAESKVCLYVRRAAAPNIRLAETG
jgi:FkbM family methyltransferase